MLKKNDTRTKEIARMGAITKNKLYPHTKGEFKKGSKRSSECGKKGFAANMSKNPNHQSMAGQKSRSFENRIAAKLEGDYIFKPNEVCDRIVIRDGEVYFVEIKQPGRKLTHKQSTFQEIVGKKYQVVRS